MKLNIYILERATLLIKEYKQSFFWEINKDYLTNEKSRFELIDETVAEQGDYILAKFENSAKIAFFGLVEELEKNIIIASDFYNILNFDFAATRKTGISAGEHILNLINYNLIWDTSKNANYINITKDTSSDIAYTYLPNEPPTTTNLNEYLINFFKKYNVILDIDNIDYREYNKLEINVTIKQISERIKLKNNSYNFVDFEINVTKQNINQENMLLIVDKATTNSETPIILKTYYLKTNGDITEAAADGVRLPTRQKIYIYDTTETDKPSYLEVAQAELAGTNYAHEINFKVKKDNKLIDIEKLKIGVLVDLVYNDTLYQSVITGYVLSSENEFIELRLGHVRSSLQQILQNYKKK